MSGKCCSSFLPQFYRKFLCTNCFQDIAQHFPGEWEKVSKLDGDVYLNKKSGQKIATKAAAGSIRANASGSAASSKWENFGRPNPDAIAPTSSQLSSGAESSAEALPPGRTIPDSDMASKAPALCADDVADRSNVGAVPDARLNASVHSDSGTIDREYSASENDVIGGITSGPTMVCSDEAGASGGDIDGDSSDPVDPHTERPHLVSKQEEPSTVEDSGFATIQSTRIPLRAPLLTPLAIDGVATASLECPPGTPTTPSRAPTTGPRQTTPMPTRPETQMEPRTPLQSSIEAPATPASTSVPSLPQPRELTPADLRIRFYNASAAIFGEQRARRHLRSENVAATFARPGPTNAGPFAFRVGAAGAGLWDTGRAWAGGARYGAFVPQGVAPVLLRGLDSAGGLDGGNCVAAYAQQLLEVCPGLPRQVSEGKRKGQKQVPRLLVLTPHSIIALHPVEPQGGHGPGQGSPKPDKGKGIRAARAVFAREEDGTPAAGASHAGAAVRKESSGTTDDGWGSDDDGEEDDDGMLCLVQWERSLVSLFTTELVPPAGAQSASDVDPATGRRPRTDVILRFGRESWNAPFGGRRCLRAWRRRLAAEHDCDQRLGRMLSSLSSTLGPEHCGDATETSAVSADSLLAAQPAPKDSEEVGRMVEVAECSHRGWLQKRPSKGSYFSRWVKRYARLFGPQQEDGSRDGASDYNASFCLAYTDTDVVPSSDRGAHQNPDAEIVRRSVAAGRVLFLTPGGVSRVRATCAMSSMRPYLSSRPPTVLTPLSIGGESGTGEDHLVKEGVSVMPSLPSISPIGIRVITQDTDRELQLPGGGSSGSGGTDGSSPSFSSSSAAALGTWVEALCAVQQAGTERSSAPIRLHFPNEEAAASFHDRVRAAVQCSKDVHDTVAQMQAEASDAVRRQLDGIAGGGAGDGGRGISSLASPLADVGEAARSTRQGRRQWRYIDDFGRQQGPFTEEQMREWTSGGYFQAGTLVRCVTPPAGVDLQAGLMQDETCMLLPLQVLFSDPDCAFDGGAHWVPDYNRAAQYQLVVKMATELGADPTLAVEKAMAMQENSLPPELSILLDLIGMRNIGTGAGSGPGVPASDGSPVTQGAQSHVAVGENGVTLDGAGSRGSGSPAKSSGSPGHSTSGSGLIHMSPLLGPGGPDAATAATIAAMQAEAQRSDFSIGAPASTSHQGPHGGDAELQEALRRSMESSRVAAAGGTHTPSVADVGGHGSRMQPEAAFTAADDEEAQFMAALEASRVSSGQHGGGQVSQLEDPSIAAAIRASLAQQQGPA